MKVNNKELAELSSGEATIEGRLHHKKIGGGYSHSVFKEKWFKLRANILFYFNLSETGQIFDKKPAGAFILENVIVQYEMNSEAPFSFSIYFNDELEKKHLFSSRTQENVNKWVTALKQSSYEYWRAQLMLLQEKLKLITGQDPLLLYPRNEGCKHSFRELTKNSVKSDCKMKVQNSTFHLYSVHEDTESEEKSSVTSSLDLRNHSNGVDDKSENIATPIRPARGNKPKQEFVVVFKRRNLTNCTFSSSELVTVEFLPIVNTGNVTNIFNR